MESRTKLQRFLHFNGTLKSDLEHWKRGGEGLLLLNDLYESPPPVDDALPSRLQNLARTVDTTLFRAYMLASPSMAGPLFRLPNFCDATVVKEKLLDTKRYSDLVDFLYGKNLHAQALDLLARFGKDEGADDGPEQLKGPRRTVAYLQNLGPSMIDLVFKYSEWPIRVDSNLGMEVFLTDTENAETLPRDRVLEFLNGIDTELAIKYLEHIIYELNESSSGFHQTLIEQYLKKFKSLARGNGKDELKSRILHFLRTSNHYEYWKILNATPRDDEELFEVRAVILGNVGEHRQALSIYVFSMNAPEKAEEYCNQTHVKQVASGGARVRGSTAHSSEDGHPSVYQMLLSLYLSPPSPHKPQWGPALDILTRHGSRLPASSSLGLIPEILPVQKLEAYFTARVRAGNAILAEGQVVAGLRKVVDLEDDAKLRLGAGRNRGSLGRNRNVVITEERVCGVCHKRFGGSAIKVLPE